LLRNADPTEWRDIKHTEDAHPHRIELLTDAQLYAIATRGAHAAGDAIRVSIEPDRSGIVGDRRGEGKTTAKACLLLQSSASKSQLITKVDRYVRGSSGLKANSRLQRAFVTACSQRRR
jgi:hypothetical protein